jgi:hypothetical protein
MPVLVDILHITLIMPCMQAVYFRCHGDLPKALEHYLECANWQKARSIFVTSVAHKLFSSGKSFCLYSAK